MPYFYHYTDEAGAQNIIRTGKILASVSFKVTGDAAGGNGVYLTKLKPRTSSKTEIAMNNWTKTSALYICRTENCFVLDIPESDVKEVSTQGRNIFLLRGRSDLRLDKYPWWLQIFDSGRVIASYKYKVTSLGPASNAQGERMGDYLMSDQTANGMPVYKNTDSTVHLFMNSGGTWSVGRDAGEDKGTLRQRGTSRCKNKQANNLGPDANIPWKYYDYEEDSWKDDDDTLKAYPWQK